MIVLPPLSLQRTRQRECCFGMAATGHWATIVAPLVPRWQSEKKHHPAILSTQFRPPNHRDRCLMPISCFNFQCKRPPSYDMTRTSISSWLVVVVVGVQYELELE